jgi:VWFA-related protein
MHLPTSCGSADAEKPQSRAPFSLAVILAISFFLAAAARVNAQESSPGQNKAAPGRPAPDQAALHSDARLVLLDVVVTDKAGNPVPGLTKDDFKILEDGKPQAIASFETPEMHLNASSTSSAGPGSAEAKEPAASLAAASRAETVLVLDELNTTSVDASFGWQMLLKYLRKQPASLEDPTAIMVLTKHRLTKIADFTRDTALLIQKAQKIEFELPSHSSENGLQGAADLMLASLLALDEIALSNAHRQTHKNVIWIGTGFPVLSTFGVDLVDRERFLSYIRYTANWMQETRTTVYTIDPRGLPVDETALLSSNIGSTYVGQDFGSVTGELMFESVAPATGGKIFRNRNDVDVALAIAAANGATYYTLAYYPQNLDFDGKFRKIDVRIVDRPDLLESTQAGYYAIDEGFGASKSELDFALSRAVTSPLPFASVQFDAVGKVLLAPPPTARVSVSVDGDTLSWSPQPDGAQRTEITVVTAEMTNKFAVLDYKVKEMEIVVLKENFESSTNHRIVFTVNVPLPPKTDHLRFVIRDAATGRLGTYDAPRQGLGQQFSASK